MATIKLPCKCQSSFQDSVYGNGIRLCNTMKEVTKHKCTVCSTIHSKSIDAVKGVK